MSYKKDFIEFMLVSEVLMFGDFTTKSGRKTPFFINTGKYKTGEQIRKLGEFYAQAIEEHLHENYDVLYGPAYKGIPLVVTAAVALSAHHDVNTAYCFNRKEAKDHGEGGVVIGHTLKDNDRVVIVEDVMTAGTSIQESVPLLKAQAKVQLSGIIISVDRMERGKTEISAQQEVFETYGIKTYAIVTMKDVVETLHNKTVLGKVYIDDAMKARIDEYYALYGAKQ